MHSESKYLMGKFCIFPLVIAALLVGSFVPLSANAQQQTNTQASTNNPNDPLLQQNLYPLGNPSDTQTGPTGAGSAATTRGNSTNNTQGPGGNAFSSCEQWDFAICIGAFIYIVPEVSAYIAYIAAFIFDIITRLSINSSAYGLDFLSQGWSVMLSVANMAILFILIYIAITIMFNADTGGTKKMLATLIAVALLVNFSFFITRVVIDAGNIFATEFYNAISAPAFSVGAPGGGRVSDLTFGIMQAIGVQTIWSSDEFNTFTKEFGPSSADKVGCAIGSLWVPIVGCIVGTVTANTVTGGGANGIVDPLQEIGVMFILFISAAVIYWILIYMFLFVAVKFIYRTIGLWFVIMTAPIAFISYATQQGQDLSKKWANYLIQFSVFPAAFFFIFLIINHTVQALSGAATYSANGTTTSTNTTLVGSVLGSLSPSSGSLPMNIATAIVRTGLVVVMLYFGLKASEFVAGQANKVAHKVSGSVVGFAGNMASRTSKFGRDLAFVGLGATAEYADQRLARTRLGNTPIVDQIRKRSTQRVSEFGKDQRQELKQRARTRADNLRDIENIDAVKRAGAALTGGRKLEPADKDRVQRLSKREFSAVVDEMGVDAASLAVSLVPRSTIEGFEGKEADKEKLIRAWEGRGTASGRLTESQRINARQIIGLGSPESALNKVDKLVESIQDLQKQLLPNHKKDELGLDTTSGVRVTSKDISKAITIMKDTLTAIKIDGEALSHGLQTEQGRLAQAMESRDQSAITTAKTNISQLKDLLLAKKNEQSRTEDLLKKHEDLRPLVQAIGRHFGVDAANEEIPAGEFHIL